MRLERVKLYNFRSFAEEQTIRFDDLTTIIGNNSSGKTAALAALNLIFSQNSSDRLLKRSDFHIPYDIKPDEMQKQDMYIEAVFSFEEVQSDDGERAPSIPLFYNSMVVDSPEGNPILRIRLTASWEKSSNIDGSVESVIEYITCPEDEEITDKERKKALRVELDYIRVLYVPASRNPSTQLKNVSGTMIHQVLSTIRWCDSTKQSVKDTIEQLNNHFISETGVAVLNDSIHEQWKHYDSDERYSNAVLRFNSTDIETSMKNSEVYFSPTVTEKEYTIDEMGDGLRSLFYISMVNSILDVETEISKENQDETLDDEDRAFLSEPPVLTIVAIEEPENHIAPQLLGKLIHNLKCIANKDNAQVVLTSHSPAIVKRVAPENLRYFRMCKPEMHSSIKEITLPEKEKYEDQYKYIKEAVRAYPEIYFAKLVVLGEGDSEEIILPRYFEAYGTDLDMSGISVVPLGGRYVNHFWRLLSDLDIPCITLLDLDREREGGGWGRIKYATNQLIEIGCNREDLLMSDDGTILSDDEFKEMHKWQLDVDAMKRWIDRLEKYNVYFSNPLDIDFLMLETMGEQYKSILEENEGPRLCIEKDGRICKVNICKTDMNQYKEEYKKRIESDVRSTLKKEGGNGDSYTGAQKELMLWYNYFFLNRGKPTTHISVMAEMTDDELRMNTPEVIKRLIEKAKHILMLGVK